MDKICSRIGAATSKSVSHFADSAFRVALTSWRDNEETMGIQIPDADSSDEKTDADSSDEETETNWHGGGCTCEDCDPPYHIKLLKTMAREQEKIIKEQEERIKKIEQILHDMHHYAPDEEGYKEVKEDFFNALNKNE